MHLYFIQSKGGLVDGMALNEQSKESSVLRLTRSFFGLTVQ